MRRSREDAPVEGHQARTCDGFSAGFAEESPTWDLAKQYLWGMVALHRAHDMMQGTGTWFAAALGPRIW